MSHDHLLTELKKIAKLRDEGVLSEAEFKKVKQKILEQQGITQRDAKKDELCHVNESHSNNNSDKLYQHNESTVESEHNNYNNNLSHSDVDLATNPDSDADSTNDTDSINTTKKNKSVLRLKFLIRDIQLMAN